MLSVTGKGITCKEVELSYTKGGTAVCNTTIVNNEEYNGEKIPHFTNLVVWGETAEDFAKEISKGCLIDIKSGILKHPVNEYKGKKQYRTQVVVLDWELVQKFEDKKDKPPANSKRGSSRK
jgi:single-stranded DNA-binding protein